LLDFVKPGGVTVSSVSPPDNKLSGAKGVRTDFLIVDVDTRSLEELFQAGVVRPSVGKVLPPSASSEAHELMAQASRAPGKIVLQVADSQNG
jgi:NADPH:quinone reductase-like Zn-dependent oxidoreductase